MMPTGFLDLDSEQSNLRSAMKEWWEAYFVAASRVMEEEGTALFTDEEENLLEALYAPIYSPSVQQAFCEAHEIDSKDRGLQDKLVRAGILYAFLIGRGMLKPEPPPYTHEQIGDVETASQMVRRMVDRCLNRPNLMV